MNLGTTLKLTATASYTDGTARDVTNEAAWSSSDETAAKVMSAGLIKAMAGGSATISAAFGGASGAFPLIVKSASATRVDVLPGAALFAKGTSIQFAAVAWFSDYTTEDVTEHVAWASSSSTVVIDGNGLASGISEGPATITATFLGITGSTTVTVDSAALTGLVVGPISASSASVSIAKGVSVALAATAIFSDNGTLDVTRAALWSSSDTAIATVADDRPHKGVVRGVAPGAASITASYHGQSASLAVAVSAATLDKVSLLPVNPSLPRGAALQFTAIGTYSDGSAQDLTTTAVWGSSNSAVVQIGNAPTVRGLAVGLAQGTAQITTTVEDHSDTTTLTVTPAILRTITIAPAFPTLAKGTSIWVSATGLYSDGSKHDLTHQASWQTSDLSVLAVAYHGLDGDAVASAISVGSVTLTATLGGISGSTRVTVSPAVLRTIEVTPPDRVIAKGAWLRLWATGTYSDGTTQDLTRLALWKSSDASVAVSNSEGTPGLVSGQVEGKATITATFGGIGGGTTVTVTKAALVSLAIKPSAPSLAAGMRRALSVIGTYTDNSTLTLTEDAWWYSSDNSVAWVSNSYADSGTVFGIKPGTATITAWFDTKFAITTVTVSPATLIGLVASPQNATVAVGTWIHLTVSGLFSDHSYQPVTEQAVWTSSDDSIAVVSNAERDHGRVLGMRDGRVTITATYSGGSASVQVLVSRAALTRMVVTPADPAMKTGALLSLIATASFADKTTQDLTDQVIWDSQDSSVVTVSNAAGSKGLATALKAGTAKVAATLWGQSGAINVTVRD